MDLNRIFLKHLLPVSGGALYEEKLRTQRQLIRKLELENQITTASVLNLDALSAGFAQLADALSSVVMSDPNLDRKSKEDFLRNLSNWPLILDGVANRQSKLARGNGQIAEEDVSES